MKAELGVLTWTQIETEDYQTNEFLNNIKVDRSYNYGVSINSTNMRDPIVLCSVENL
jgi:hypothetical protein